MKETKKQELTFFHFGIMTFIFSKYFQCDFAQNTVLRLYNFGVYNSIVDKDKAVPLQAWGGPEGSRKLRFPDFMTTAQDGGKFVSLTHRPPLPPGNTPGTHFC